MLTEQVGSLMPMGHEGQHNTLALSWCLGEIFTYIEPEIVRIFGVPKSDIAGSATNLLWTDGKADMQIEIRYTGGIDIYENVMNFEPSLATQERLKKAVIAAIRSWLKLPGNNFQISISIQTVLTRGSYSFSFAEPTS